MGWFGEGKDEVRGGTWQLTGLGGGRGGAGERLRAEPGTPERCEPGHWEKGSEWVSESLYEAEKRVREEDLLILKQDRSLSH